MPADAGATVDGVDASGAANTASVNTTAVVTNTFFTRRLA
jgi:hypothetical protein